MTTGGVKVRKGGGPPSAVLVETRRTTWVDFWGQEVPVEEVLAVTVIKPTGEYLPQRIEPGTNGTEAVEALAYIDADGDRFYSSGGGLWAHADGSDNRFFFDLSWRSGARFVRNGEPITADQLQLLATLLHG